MGDDQGMVNISAAYTGRWASRYRDLAIRYNEKVWNLAESVDTGEDTLFGLTDGQDGASFLLRVEYVRGAERFDDRAYVQALADGILDAAEPLGEAGCRELTLAGLRFHCADYRYHNPRFGEQLLRHAFMKHGDYVVVMALAWPVAEPLVPGGRFPLRHTLLLEGVRIGPHLYRQSG
ncbi:MAG: hypothetical protein AB2813_10945 [Candidatus Sedimenticola endophacoides]